MSQRRSDIDAELQRIYDRIPDVECKGLCHDACGPIGMSQRERSRIRERGVKIPLATHQDVADTQPCPALKDGRCTVYGVRPTICRLWGATEDLPCPYGCRPVNGEELLPSELAYKLLAAAMQAGGDTGYVKTVTPQQLEEYMGRHPEILPILRAGIQRGQAEDMARAQARRRRGK